MRRAISALLIAIAAAFAVAACGGGDDAAPPTKAEFKQQYLEVSKEITATGLAVGKAINGATGKSNKEIAASFSDVADRTRDVATRLDNTTPSADAAIETQHAKLVKGLNVVADDLEAVGKAAAKNDLKGAGAAAAKLNRDDAGITGPKAALEKALGIAPATPPPSTTTTQK